MYDLIRNITSKSEIRYDFNIIIDFVLCKNKGICPTIRTKRLFRRDKTPIVVSWLNLRLNWYILENAASFAWKD